MTTKTNEEIIAASILPLIGGVTNVVDVSSCMTRLRLTVKETKLVKSNELKKIPGVLGLITDGYLVQIVLGPGVVRKVTDEFNELVRASREVALEVEAIEKESRAPLINENDKPIVKLFKRIGNFIKNIKWKRGLRHIGNIFSPLVPGFICFGILYSITVIIQVSASGGSGNIVKPNDLVGPSAGFYWFFYALAFGFMSYLSIFVGYNAAKEFNATPTLGGILGGVAIVPKLLDLAKTIGWAGNIVGETYPYSLIDAGRGGVFTVILAVFLMSFIERLIRKKMPNVLDTVFSPLITIVLSGAILLFAIMPAMGFVSNGITEAIHGFGGLPVVARAAIGFVLAGFFLPLVMFGLHHGFTTIYTELGTDNMLYPIFAMADASQAGVGLAIYLKAKKYKHDRLKQNAAAGVVPQVLGVSEPLIYGVTLPLIKPFITVGIGAAIGGAFIAAMDLRFIGFDVSGLLGVLLAGNLGGDLSNLWKPRLVYLAGWLISALSGFIATWFLIKESDLNKMPKYDTFVSINK